MQTVSSACYRTALIYLYTFDVGSCRGGVYVCVMRYNIIANKVMRALDFNVKNLFGRGLVYLDNFIPNSLLARIICNCYVHAFLYMHCFCPFAVSLHNV